MEARFIEHRIHTYNLFSEILIKVVVQCKNTSQSSEVYLKGQMACQKGDSKMSKRSLYTIAGSISCGLFVLAIVLFASPTRHAEIKLVALADGEMERLTGGFAKPRDWKPSPGCNIALCPFLGECDASWKNCHFSWGKCVSCTSAGQRKYGSVSNKLILSKTRCKRTSEECIFVQGTQTRVTSCQINVHATCT